MNWRSRHVVSLLGTLRLTHPYYHCASCGESDRSWLAGLRLNEQALTPAAAELAALAGVRDNFAEAVLTLRKMSGVRLSESTVERTTEDAGARLRARLAAGGRLGPTEPWDWQRDAAGRTAAYVSVDATGIRRQGPRASRAEGRMAYVGMLYNPAPRDESGPMHARRYLAGFYELDQLGRELHAEGLSVGWAKAEVQLALTDGAPCLETFVHRWFPKARVILDFWHAAEHVSELARIWATSEEAGQTLSETWRRQLREQGGAALLAEWERLDLSGRSADVQETWRRETNYLRNNLHRTDYPSYLAAGWQIGSGPIEAACKTVVNQRLNLSGMRWGDDGADSICALRALYLSSPRCWDAFWAAAA